MGIVAQQSKLNAIYVFTGFAIGGITNILFPRWFGDDVESLGIIQFVVTYAILFAQFLNMGSHMIIIRNYPKYVSESKTEKAFFYGWFFPLVGLFVFGLFMLFANKLFFELSSKEKINYPNNELALIIFLITFFITYTRSIGSIAVAKMYTSYATFINEVFIRLLLFVSVIMYFLGWINFSGLLWLHVISYFVQLLCVFPVTGLGKITPSFYPHMKEIKSNIAYGIFAMFESGAAIIINRIDVMMLAALVSLEVIPVYVFAFALATVLLLPARALNLASVSIVADYYHHSKWNEIADLYKRSATIQFTVGALIFLIIWVSLDELFMFVPKVYSAGKFAFFFLGISKLFDLITSINGMIIQVSKWYWYNFLFNIVLLALAIVTNIFLIPNYGVTGASIATAISLLLFNTAKTIFLFNKLNMHPFSKKIIYPIILLVLLMPIESINLDVHYIYSLLIKSGITATAFIGLCYMLNVSEDLNNLFNKKFKLKK